MELQGFVDNSCLRNCSSIAARPSEFMRGLEFEAACKLTSVVPTRKRLLNHYVQAAFR